LPATLLGGANLIAEYSMLDLWWENWQLEEVTSTEISVPFASL